MSATQRPGGGRPLSPHLQVYKPQLTSVLSISHRIAGIGLSLGLLYLAAWVVCAASGPSTYTVFQSFNGSILGKVCLFGWTLAGFFHLANGIRHLFWDAGHGLELKAAYASGWATVAAAAGLTVVSWALAYAMR